MASPCPPYVNCDRTLGKCVSKCDGVTCSGYQICDPRSGTCCTRNCTDQKCSDDDGCGGHCSCPDEKLCDPDTKICMSCSKDCTDKNCEERNECGTTCGCTGQGQTCSNKQCLPCMSHKDCDSMGQICINKECVPCSLDIDCADMVKKCSSGTCVYK